MAERDADERVPLRRFLSLFSAVMLPMFLASADQTMLATATPAIARELGGLRDAAWAALAYLLGVTFTVPAYGAAGDRWGRRPVLMASLGLFALGSLAAAAAQSMPQLIVARALQGVGGGGLMVLSQSLIGELVPPIQRPRFQGWFAANFTLASLAGPMIGAWLVEHAHWRWLFAINLPLVAIAMWRTARLPAPDAALAHERAEAPAPFADGAGIALFAIAVTSGLVWVTFGGARFAWTSTPGLLLGALALASAAALAWRERRAAAPFIPVDLLRRPAIAHAAAMVVAFATAFFGVVFYVPILLHALGGPDPTPIGLALASVSAGMVAGAMLAGRVVARTGRPRPTPVLGLSVAAVALAIIAWRVDSLVVVQWALPVVGLGFGTVMPAAQVVVQTVAGRSRLGAASALISLSRSLGASAGTALIGAVLFGLAGSDDITRLAAGTPESAEASLTAFRAAFLVLAATAAAGAAIAASAPSVDLRQPAAAGQPRPDGA